MAIEIKPQDILKRLYTRYYPGITVFSLLTLYGAFVVFPDENIPLLLLMFHTGQFFCWLLIVLALRHFNPVRFYMRVMVIIAASLTVVLFSYMGMALYLGFKPFHFISSPLSANILIMILLMAVICSGTTILAERSLIAEKKYLEEKTRRLTSEKRLVEDQLNLLQTQIEPRFLFNTMESICTLFDTAPEKANAMQMHFIQYLRATLVKTRAKTTTIEQEMDLIRSYMDIFKVSMQERLEYQIDVDPLAKKLPFPSLLIQPIVEDLIKNGLELYPEGGRILISVKRAENTLLIKIADTARRINAENSLEDMLGNIKIRLKSLFQDKGIIRLEENLPAGAAVLMEVPCG